MNMNQVCLNIAGILVNCIYDSNQLCEESDLFWPFVNKNSSHKEDILLNIKAVNKIESIITGEICASTPCWKLKKAQDKWIFDFYEKDSITCNLIINPDFSNGDIIILKKIIDLTKILPVYVLSLILMNYLAIREKGIIFHGAAVDCKNIAFILTGKSGSGKSTLSALFRDEGFFKYGDDKLVLIKKNDVTVCSSTPFDWKEKAWHNYSKKLNFIFFLKHSKDGKNKISELDKQKAIRNILYTNYIPFYLEKGVEKHFDLMNILLKNIQIMEYEFVPNKSSVDDLVKFFKEYDYETI